MITSRIIYIFALTASALLYVLYPHWFSWYLFVLFLLLIPFDLLISLPGMLTGRISLTVPTSLEQGEKGAVTAMTVRGKPFPSGCIKAWLRVSGSGSSAWRRIKCGAAHGSLCETAIDTSHSGVGVFSLGLFWASSLFGLFSMPLHTNYRAVVLVLPKPVKPPYSVLPPRAVVFRPKPGGGFSEEHDLRPFHQGDSLRNVHWKLSAKFNSLIIREPLAPPAHSRLVQVARWTGPLNRDLILGRLLWVSDYLLARGLHHYVRLGDSGPAAEITGAEDLTVFLRHALDGALPALSAPASMPSRFSWVFPVDAREAAK